MKELTVTMFGGFEVTYGETAVIPRDARNSKVVQLFQYLLCRRGSMIPQGELIEVLLGEADCANPLAVLKNIVYRLRKMCIRDRMKRPARILRAFFLRLNFLFAFPETGCIMIEVPIG